MRRQILFPLLKKIENELDELTLLDQQLVLELLAAQHILKAALPDAAKLDPIMERMFSHILRLVTLAVEEGRHRASKNKS